MTPPGIYQSRQRTASLKAIYFLETTGLIGRKEVVTEGRTGMKDLYNKALESGSWWERACEVLVGLPWR